MELILIFVMIFIFGIFVIVLGSPNSSQNENHENAGNTKFGSPLNEERLSFLTEFFNLNEKECRELHFDGFQFYFDPLFSYQDFTMVTNQGYETVEIRNPELPHIYVWDHERSDGGPDLRYNNNKSRMVSFRYTLKFEGDKNYSLYLYRESSYKSYRENEDLITKINKLFLSNKTINLEEKYTRFQELFRKRKLSLDTLKSLLSRKTEVEKEISACKRLLTNLIEEDISEITQKYGDLIFDLENINNQIEGLETKVTTTSDQIKSMVKEIEILVTIQIDLKIIS